jgi:hypothetical protein
MTKLRANDPNMSLGEFLKGVKREGALVEKGGKVQFAVMPLDDDVLDLLLERSPRLIEECRQIRARAKGGDFKTLAEVKRIFGLDKKRIGRASHRKIKR